MTVEELIKKLEKMPKDATVAVECRDTGGSYYELDYDVEPFLNEKVMRYPIGVVIL